MTSFDPTPLAPVVPVVALKNVNQAVPLAKALLAGGIRCIEITFRTEAAEGAMQAIADECPDMVLGAGTVTQIDELERAHAAGAKFAVAPGLSPHIVKRAQEIGLPFFPGVANPTDIEAALNLGCKILKFFPAEPLGGASMLKALVAPYQHLGVRFVPTGGITTANASGYLKIPQVIAVGGSWLASGSLMDSGSWSEIEDLARAASELKQP